MTRIDVLYEESMETSRLIVTAIRHLEHIKGLPALA